MPPKKISWGDLPHINDIMDKDENGKWIHCKICDLRIRVRSQFSSTEWQLHTEGVKHSRLSTTKALKNVPKLTTFFQTQKKHNISSPNPSTQPKKRSKTNSCPGFFYGQNTDLLPIYAKYKKDDHMSEITKILSIDGKWSIHSVDCTGEQVKRNKSSRQDSNACKHCFNFPSLPQIKSRIKRMESNLLVEKFLMEPKSSDTAYLAISKFLKRNLSSASPETLSLIQRCKHYQSHHNWMKDNFSKLKQYNIADENGKIDHEKWLMKLRKMYHDEPSMKDSLLDSLIQFTLSRYEGNINAPCSPKLIGFFQTLYAVSPKFYRMFSQNFGGYNERTLRRFEKSMSPEVPIIDCNESSIKSRAEQWINQLKEKGKDEIILVSAMADATKVPGIGEFSQRYHVWVGGVYPNHCINEKDFKPDEFVTSKLASEIKVGMLTTQQYNDGLTPFKIIAARPQSTNESADEYNNTILHAVENITNVHCVSMAFDGLATETNFIRTNLIAFMNGTTNSVVMTDCNHAAKNLRSQLVLGTTIVTGGNALFDVGLLSLAGVPSDLYCVSDYASDVLVLKLCSSNTINKLLNLLINTNEDPLNISFMAMTLYFLRSFICAYNTADLSCEGRVTMLWSALMWFSSLKGVHPQSKHNFVTSCLGGIFLSLQRRVRNLRLTTTEPIEHAFGTARSWKREFTINEFLTYTNKIDFIMKNVLQYDIKTSTSQKGYMHGFQSFANVVKEINSKLSNKDKQEKFDPWSVDIDYKSATPIVDQINEKVITAIKRIQQPVLTLMCLYGMEDISLYCDNIESIADICSIYQKLSQKRSPVSYNMVRAIEVKENKQDELMERLTNIALDFNSRNSINDSDDNQQIVVSDIVNEVLKDQNMIEEKIDCENFFRFVSCALSNQNIGMMLHYMSRSMNTTFEKHSVDGSISSLQKVKSLQGRWFKVNTKNVEAIGTGTLVERNCIFLKNETYYRVMSVFKKSYNKWRHEKKGNLKDKMKVHLQVLDIYHCAYHANEEYQYVCEDSSNLGTYIGHAIGMRK